MRYRTKILVVLVVVSLLTNGVSLLYMYFKSKDYLFTQIQSTVRSIAATTATTVDPEHMQRLKPGDASETAQASYKLLEAHLRRLRDANRREDVYVNYVYTIHPCWEQPTDQCFGVDPEEDLELKSALGDVLPSYQIDESFHFDAPGIADEFIRDEWGEWITAWTPIRDRTGTAIASLGVDVAADDIRRQLRVLLYTSGISITASVVLAICVSLSIARHVTKPLDIVRNAVEHIGKGNLDTRIEIRAKDEFGQVASAINDMVDGLKEKGVIQKLFARYVSEDVAEMIVGSGEHAERRIQRKQVTLLFSDIRGFTSLSETMPPEEVVECLNDYFESMIPVISRNHGTLDKFMGDGLMVHFGAVHEDEQQEEHAVNTALEMREALAELCKRWEAQGRKGIAIGVGINSGIAVAGSIGSSERQEFTTIGDTVNLAARLEPLTKDLGVPIIISDSTYQAVKHRFRVTSLGEKSIRGKEAPVQLYAVEGKIEAGKATHSVLPASDTT